MTAGARAAAGRGPASNGASHLCPVRACRWRVPPGKLICPGHWRLLAHPLRALVWRSWDDGRGAGTAAHRTAVDAAIRAVNRLLEAQA